MKITYIANARIPTEKAHGIQIMKMCEAFAKNDVEVELIVAQRFNRPFKNIEPFEYYGIKYPFKLKKLFSVDIMFLENIIGPLGVWIQSFSFALFIGLYMLFKKTDIIYSRDLFSLWLLSFFKNNFVYEAHSFPKKFFLYKRIFRKAKAIVVITQRLKNVFIQKGINGNKILVAPDGVDLEEFDVKKSQKQCRRKLNLPLDKKIVLYTGHLYEWKGVQTLAKAAKFFEENVLIVFVGGTEEDISKFKTQNSKLKNVLIVGHRPHLEIPYWLKAADVLVLPNSAREKISQYWTSPMKMFEYMASQRPIVASDLPSIREILNENNAVLIKSDNAEALTEGIDRVFKNPDLSDRIAEQTYQDVQSYSWSKRVQKIIDFLS